jgi:hypothetical protein
VNFFLGEAQQRASLQRFFVLSKGSLPSGVEVSSGHFDQIQGEATFSLSLLNKGNLPSGGTPFSGERGGKEHQGCTLDWLFSLPSLALLCLGWVRPLRCFFCCSLVLLSMRDLLF